MSLVVETMPPGASSVHHVHSPELNLLGLAAASGIWAMEDYVVSPTVKFRGYGHYYEEYRKESGEMEDKFVALGAPAS